MKYIKLSLLAMLLMGISTSCFKMEEEDIFDENAATRIDHAIKNYTDILTDKGGKWMLEYYANADEPGYVYLMTFNKNGSVQMSGKNVYIGDLKGVDNSSVFASEESLWEVIGDNGPVLTFNSFNPIFHLFANPEDISKTETDEQGYGHEGDYEFDIMKYSGDTLYLDGKKYEHHMIMTRLQDVNDDEAFFNSLDEFATEFTTLIPELYLTTPSGKRYVCSGAASMIWSMYPEGGDPIMETKTYNAILNPTGVRFMNPLSILADGGDTPVQSFKLKDGKLVAEDGKTTIEAAPLFDLFTDARFKWQTDATKSSGALLEAYNAFAAGTKAYNGSTLQYIQFLTQNVADVPTKSMLFRVKMKSGSSYLNCNLYCNITGEGANVSFKFSGEGDKNALVYAQKVEAIANFMSLLENGQFVITTDKPVGPSVIKLTDKNDANSYLTFKVV